MNRVLNIKGKLIDLNEVCEISHRERTGNNEQFNEIVFTYKRGMKTTVQYETAKECFIILAKLHGYFDAWEMIDPNKEGGENE